jgi:hypothetical protein
MTKWFAFDQNNSRGEWLLPAQVVVVEARSAEHAWIRFMDAQPDMSFCECCGERWSEYVDSEFESRPLVSQLRKPYREQEGVPWLLFMPIDGVVSSVGWKEGEGR